MNFLALLASGDSKRIGLWLALAGGAVALYLGWQYVQSNSSAKQAAANLDAQGAAVQNEIASQLEQSQLSQQLSELYPGTTGTVTSAATGVGVVAPVVNAAVAAGPMTGIAGNNNAVLTVTGNPTTTAT